MPSVSGARVRGRRGARASSQHVRRQRRCTRFLGLHLCEGAPFNEDLAAAAPAAERNHVGRERGCTPGALRRGAGGMSSTAGSSMPASGTARSHVEAHRHQRRGVETAARALKIQEALHEQRRADEQHSESATSATTQRVAGSMRGRRRPASSPSLSAPAGRLRRLQRRAKTETIPVDGPQRRRGIPEVSSSE